MKPSGHAVSCEWCGQRMPYDPSAANLLCNICNRRRALGLSHNPPLQNQLFQAQNTHAFTQPSTPPSNFYYQYDSTPQPAMTPGFEAFTNSPYVRNDMPHMYLAGHKRKSEAMEEIDQSPSKRFASNAYVPSAPSALRQAAWPPGQSSGYAGGITSEAEDEDGDEFVDAPEDQLVDIGGAAVGSSAPEHISNNAADSDADTEGEEDEQYQAPSKADNFHGQPERDASPEHQPAEQAAHDEDDDLFAQTFGGGSNNNSKPASNTNAAADNNDDDSDIEEVSPATAGATFDRTAFIASVSKNTKSPNKPTTTASHIPARKPFTPKHTLGVIPAAIPRHISRHLKQYHTFHYNAINLIPRLPLASSRYWIGVLAKGHNPITTRPASEKHFTWMKGNRLTTVETIWRAYCAGNGEEEPDDVVLLVGGERPSLGVKCEELDYFGDRKVIFCAVDGKAEPVRARWRGLAEELIREVQGEWKGEVIEID